MNETWNKSSVKRNMIMVFICEQINNMSVPNATYMYYYLRYIYKTFVLIIDKCNETYTYIRFMYFTLMVSHIFARAR